MISSSFRYRVGTAGAGAFAEFLAGALAPLPSFHLAAVAGRTDEKRQRVIDAYRRRQPQAGDVREYREAEELIVDHTWTSSFSPPRRICTPRLPSGA
ncbi:hypothetical protein LR69_01470 [Geobacillus sp. BCO2]|nr:hypothetical protein LR69_01470 [Geobacillus sp. BCO2]